MKCTVKFNQHRVRNKQMNNELALNKCLRYYEREDWYHIVQYKVISTEKREWIQKLHDKLIKQTDIEEHKLLAMLYDVVTYLKANSDMLRTTQQLIGIENVF
jgi:hypothetical protein